MLSASYPYLPLWLLTLLFFLALILAREIGTYLRRRRDAAKRAGPVASRAGLQAAAGQADESKDGDAFAMTSVLGLLALLIGFTFSVALGRYDERRQLVLEEANALGTTWLRTDLLASTDRARMQDVLRRYVDARVAFADARSAREEIQQNARTSALQGELWTTMTEGIATFRDTPRASLIVATTNASIDLAAERFAARQDHIPPRILRMLLLFAMLAAGLVGYERAHQRKASTLLLLLFTLAVGLVLDLDRPSTGSINVPQDPMLDLQRSLQQASPVPPPATGADH